MLWPPCFAAACSARNGSPQTPLLPVDNSVFSVSTTLVQVDAEVTDSHQRHVTNLQPGDFEVILDHKIQPITNFVYVRLDGPNGLPAGTNSTLADDTP